jgi:hypothetical protein
VSKRYKRYPNRYLGVRKLEKLWEDIFLLAYYLLTQVNIFFFVGDAALALPHSP